MIAKSLRSNATLANPLTLSFTADLPSWDAGRRELRVGLIVVKRFRQPAKNQEMILAAFQEEGWPAHLDDPLPGGDNQDAPDRLHDTIRRLNDQKVGLIRFLADGRGQGIIWERREPAAPKKKVIFLASHAGSGIVK